MARSVRFDRLGGPRRMVEETVSQAGTRARSESALKRWSSINAKVFPFACIADAHAFAEANEQARKVVIRVGEVPRQRRAMS